MASGKTTLGKELAEKLNLKFIDLDQSIEDLEKSPVQEIIKNKGELHFRKLEKKQLHTILEQDNFVLSTGGGTPCYYNNLDILNQNSTTIYLDVPLNEIVKRLNNNLKSRPLLSHLKKGEVQEFVAKHLFERRPFYAQAQHHISSNNIIIEDLLKSIK